MKWIGMLAAILILPVLPAAAAPQSTLPAGTILPIALDHGLNASKVHAGQTIRAEVMQDVPGTTIRRGAKVVGHVAEVHASPNGPVTLEFTFDSVIEHGQTIPIRANLRALASRLEVDEAQVPEEMSSRGLNPENWTTQQIGGDQVYRGGGPVTDGLTDVGEPAPYGVLDDPRTQSGQPCRGAVDDATRPQALWLFSSDACGLYGFPNLRIEHAGRTDPIGTIVLFAGNGKLVLYGGTGMLLRVQGSERAKNRNRGL